VTLSRKGAKSQTRVRGLRSSGTKTSILVERLRTSNAELEKKLAEALEQQSATSEVLQVISSSPGELEPVFQAMLENATRICEAKFGSLYLYDGRRFRVGALCNAPSAFAEFRRREPVFDPPPGSGLAQIVATRRTVHSLDITLDPGYVDRNPIVVATVELAGFRTVLGVPMVKDEQLIGCINIYRQEVQAFTDKQIELVTNFANQAVIAIENTRLLNELRESLQQQTATSEVLSVISSSPGDLAPVFETILANATRICEAMFGTMFLYKGGAFRVVAQKDAPRAYIERWSSEPVLLVADHPAVPLARLAKTRELQHIPNVALEQAYIEGDPPFVGLVDLAGARTLIAVPMLKERDLIGAIAIFRQEVRPFTEKQIELVQNFADQAVIAIENTRLLNELRQRTDDLSESLQQQTATAEVLKVISSSPGELEPVFEAMLANATRLCEAKLASLLLTEGDQFRRVSLHNAPPALVQHWRGTPLVRPHPGSGLGQVLRTKQVTHVDDIRTTQAYLDRDPNSVAGAELGGYRTVLLVPMLKDNTLVGVINIYRDEVGRFTDKQVELVSNFAAQAVIAIENTRLLNELRQRTHDLAEALERQTVTSEVLKVISSSRGDLEPVFQALLTNATRICEAKFGALYLSEGDAVRMVATSGVSQQVDEELRSAGLRRPGPRTALGRVIATKSTAHVADALNEPGFFDVKPGFSNPQLSLVAGARTLVAVPMLKEETLVGAIVIYRQEGRPFSDKQIELLTNFAAQAVIAIENTRLLNELRESLQQQTATADVLKVISRSTFGLQAVLDTLVESAVRLCEADIGHIARPKEGGFFQTQANFGMSKELKDELGRTPFKPGRGSAISRALVERTTVQVLDAQTDPEYKLSKAQKVGGYRTIIAAPLLREGSPIGVFGLGRYSVRAFTNKQRRSAGLRCGETT
jgi:GAF domain-containing protein